MISIRDKYTLWESSPFHSFYHSIVTILVTKRFTSRAERCKNPCGRGCAVISDPFLPSNTKLWSSLSKRNEPVGINGHFPSAFAGVLPMLLRQEHLKKFADSRTWKKRTGISVRIFCLVPSVNPFVMSTKDTQTFRPEGHAQRPNHYPKAPESLITNEM